MGRHQLWTEVDFIDGVLNAQRCRDEILRPVVVPHVQERHPMLQQHNATICAQCLEAETVPVLAWPTFHSHPNHPNP